MNKIRIEILWNNNNFIKKSKFLISSIYKMTSLRINNYNSNKIFLLLIFLLLTKIITNIIIMKYINKILLIIINKMVIKLIINHNIKMIISTIINKIKNLIIKINNSQKMLIMIKYMNMIYITIKTIIKINFNMR